MPIMAGPLVAMGVLVVILLVRIPLTRRHLVRLARGLGDWVRTHCARTEEWDQDERDLWLMERRHQLCADLRRVEHLVATDTWMSATRQRGNRIAYNRLVDDLRRMPVVSPMSFQSLDPFDADPTDARWSGLTNVGFSQQPRTVEVLEIGWGRRRR